MERVEWQIAGQPQYDRKAKHPPLPFVLQFGLGPSSGYQFGQLLDLPQRKRGTSWPPWPQVSID